jgi:hypothetical protein
VNSVVKKFLTDHSVGPSHICSSWSCVARRSGDKKSEPIMKIGSLQVFFKNIVTSGALRLEAFPAVHRAAASGLEGNFGLFATSGASGGEHLLGSGVEGTTAAAPLSTAATIAAAIASRVAAAVSTTTATATPPTALIGHAGAGEVVIAIPVAAGLGGFASLAAGLAALGGIHEALVGEYLLLIRGKLEFRAAIHAQNALVLVRHSDLQGK